MNEKKPGHKMHVPAQLYAQIEDAAERKGVSPDQYVEQTIEDKTRIMNAVRRRYYVMARLKASDFKKLRKWLDQNEKIEIATDSHDKVYLFNSSRIRIADFNNLKLFH